MSAPHDHLALRTVFVNAHPTARQLRKARLVVTEGPDRGRDLPLLRTRAVGGRSPLNDLPLSDAAVSATHFEIEAVEQGYILRDLGSTNGTTVRGLRIREIFLQPDLAFQVGNTTLTFQPSADFIDIPLSSQRRFGPLLGASVPMREAFALLEKIAPTDLNVLIEGETGTGKERTAEAIHQHSRRKDKPFVVLDCSSIPRDLVESTVFGHEKGAFTGAIAQHRGAFEQADGGTLFLDEIGELDLALQPRLLRALENREIKRVGADRTLRVNVRILAATHRDLRKMVAEGTFREDLYFRLSVMQVRIPPLRERPEDIPLLAAHLLANLRDADPRQTPLRLDADALHHLQTYPWPGNVRELKNALERAASLSDGDTLHRHDLHLGVLAPSTPRHAPPPPTPHAPLLPYKDARQRLLDDFERDYLTRLIHDHDGNVSQAARAAGLTRYHLRELLKKHGLRPTAS